MTVRKTSKRVFNGMGYASVQRINSKNKKKLQKEDWIFLKDHNYKNVGWDNVINLYQKIEEFLDKSKPDDRTLEELFLEADRIGNKYLTSQEIAEFNQKMSQEVNDIAKEIDSQFPDREIEIIDFSKSNSQSRRTLKSKSNKTIKR